jgi:hypothetical protein
LRPFLLHCPALLAAAPAPKRRKLSSDAIFGMRVGTEELDRLWNLTEDNLSGGWGVAWRLQAGGCMPAQRRAVCDFWSVGVVAKAGVVTRAVGGVVPARQSWKPQLSNRAWARQPAFKPVQQCMHACVCLYKCDYTYSPVLAVLFAAGAACSPECR